MGTQSKVAEIQQKLEKMASDGADQSKGLELLKTLRDLPMNLEILTSTRVGMTVNKLRKASDDKDVISLAKTLIRKWKKYLPETEGKDSPTSNTTPTKGEKRPDSDGEAPVSKKAKVEKESSSNNKQSSNSNYSKGSTSFPPCNTTDSVRLKCREMLMTAITADGVYPDGSNDPQMLAERLEEEIYKEFNNTDTKYKNRIRSRFLNLKDAKNPNLRINYLVGSISSARLARMTAEEMASDEMKDMRDKFMKEGINDSQLATNQGTKTDLLKCNKCGKRDCTYNQLQTRSSDEPMTTFVLCNNCGNRWKFC